MSDGVYGRGSQRVLQICTTAHVQLYICMSYYSKSLGRLDILIHEGKSGSGIMLACKRLDKVRYQTLAQYFRSDWSASRLKVILIHRELAMQSLILWVLYAVSKATSSTPWLYGKAVSLMHEASTAPRSGKYELVGKYLNPVLLHDNPNLRVSSSVCRSYSTVPPVPVHGISWRAISASTIMDNGTTAEAT